MRTVTQQMRTFSVLVAVCTSAICAASLHIGGTASAAPTIPNAWDETALADWATPIAALNVRPTNVSARDYYSMAVENLRTYPVYFPGREPDGYWEMLQRVGPKRLIEPEQLTTEAD
jgi:hypothetical protein